MCNDKSSGNVVGIVISFWHHCVRNKDVATTTTLGHDCTGNCVVDIPVDCVTVLCWNWLSYLVRRVGWT